MQPDTMGVLAIRPSAILSDPAMKPLTAMANMELTQLRQLLKLSAEPKLSIEEIEEIITSITIVPGDKKHGRNHSLMAGLTMIRATHDFDWLKLMRQLDPKTEEVRHKDRVYYRSHFSALGVLSGPSPNATFGYFMPDKRTVAFVREKSLSAFVKGQKIHRPHFSWDKDWKRVEHGLIAVAMDNRWANGLSKEQIGDDTDPLWVSLVQNTSTMVAGVEWKDGIDFHAYLTGKDQGTGTQTVKDIKTVLAQWRRDPVQAPSKDASENERRATAFHMQMIKDLLEHARVRRQESTVRLHMTAKINLADFAKYIFLEQSFEVSPK
ncbi:MAG TPA: hypothetical protein VMF69_07250 [Gemmataceae bacterium]|nr:hypothetical protein [Gemmataceae bacterium]